MDVKQELQDKLTQLNDQLKGLGGKVEGATKAAVSEARVTAQGELNHLSDQMGRKVDAGKSQLSSDLLKARMNVSAKAKEVKDALVKTVSEKKYESAKAKAKYEADVAVECAADSLDAALLAAAEAKVAYLEAVEKQLDYQEKYADK